MLYTTGGPGPQRRATRDRRRVRGAGGPLRSARPVARARARGLLARAVGAAGRDGRAGHGVCPKPPVAPARRCSIWRSRSRPSAAGWHRRRWWSTRSRLGCSRSRVTTSPPRSSTAPPSPPLPCGRRAMALPAWYPPARSPRTSSRSTARSWCSSTSAPGALIENLGSSPLADRALDDGDRRVLATGDDARAAARARGRRMAGADRGGARRARARCAHHRGALRDRARAVRGAHRLVPEPPARARRRRRRSRRGPAARPQGGLGVRRRPPRRRRSSRPWPSCSRPSRRSALRARALHYHGGYGFMEEYDIQLFYRRAKGWANVARRARHASTRASPTSGTASAPPRWADVDFTPSDTAVQFGNEVRALLDAGLHRRTPPARARHRHHARLGAAPGDGRQRLDRAGPARGPGGRRTRPGGAGGALPRAGAGRRTLRRPEHLHDVGVGHRARGQRHAAARRPAQAAGGRGAHRARVLRARLRVRCRRRPHARGARRRAVGASTARRSSPAWPRSPSGCSSSPAPIRTCPSTRDSRSSSCRRRHPASSSSRSAPCRASAPTPRSTTVCTSTTSGASAR